MASAEATDRLSIRELIDAYAHCADRRDAKGQMALFHRRHRVPRFHGHSVSGTELCHPRPRSTRPVFADLNRYQATTHFNGQSIVRLSGDRATAESYCIAHHLTVNGLGGL
ncbi:nuclear transport factor 2 family protein [Mesorhizobium sp. AR10]|uniref:nuclear transport factor 2 family protein n=1 Tax=Mesorhizobium sp. AR10 TaxID=2865839 RepID=UPI00215E6615|nr:nuclear transport factor 2 family protein [Mesorhizobium sp. AR10]UVK38823.1 nuclear transport factor 2 family protein [Mesorhizobium sp. AR10]